MGTKECIYRIAGPRKPATPDYQEFAHRLLRTSPGVEGIGISVRYVDGSTKFFTSVRQLYTPLVSVK